MANTTKLVDRFLEIKGLDADWSIPGDLAGFVESGIQVKSITFFPSAANDIAVIKAGTPSQLTTAAAIATAITAPRILSEKTAGETKRLEFGPRGTRMWPFIDISDWTLSTPANARLLFELA